MNGKVKILPALKRVPLKLLEKLTGKPRRMVIDMRAGRSRPHPKNQNLLADILRELGMI
jgi:hypothetical protein